MLSNLRMRLYEVTKIFLDTTLVVVASDAKEVRHKAVSTFIRSNSPAATPRYALRELLAGRLQSLCNVHNRLKASDNIGEALLSLARANPAMGRKKGAQIEDFARVLKGIFESKPELAFRQVADEMAQSLALQVTRFWFRATRPNGWDIVQPLGCMPSGDFSIGESGELRPPSGSFNCAKDSRCSAAAYLEDEKASISKLCDALHPARLDAVLAEKRETSSRRAALKDLRDNGSKKFNKRGCRALGDAYFVVMSPGVAKIATTNGVDFEPMCAALGKQWVSP